MILLFRVTEFIKAFLNVLFKIIDLKYSLAEQHKLYLKDSEPVMNDTNLKEEEWITNSNLSSEKFSKDIIRII